jgi:hypothetical protein
MNGVLGVTYTTPVGVGNPPTECTLLIDTGMCESICASQGADGVDITYRKFKHMDRCEYPIQPNEYQPRHWQHNRIFTPIFYYTLRADPMDLCLIPEC